MASNLRGSERNGEGDADGCSAASRPGLDEKATGRKGYQINEWEEKESEVSNGGKLRRKKAREVVMHDNYA